MDPSNSQEDQYKLIIAALLRDVRTLHGDVFTHKAEKLTYRKICRRLSLEGIGFLTKTLPRLGKALDRALSSNIPLTVPYECKLSGTQLPKLFGELFSSIFDADGKVLPLPCVASIKTLRQLLYLFYKLKLPWSSDQEQDVLDKFERTEEEVRLMNTKLGDVSSLISHSLDRVCSPLGVRQTKIIRRARTLLSRVLASLDLVNIVPKHGPGAVSTKEQLWGKYFWSDIPDRISAMYPIDEYFFVSQTHVVDRIQELTSLGDADHPARVILVPKDSRGPRLISAEPLVNQWIQQGIKDVLVPHIERHPLTRCRINFEDQGPNRRGALIGSIDGKYATLDLNEASDRISLGLVRLLFPQNVVNVLEAVRSLSTQLPNGRILNLDKHAPMGSALCFPILALSVWAILNAAAGSDTDTRERILVYGDDVIVPRAFAPDAIEQLSWFGLKLNLDKSCTEGFFRESCGMDAYLGVDVTPVRFRTGPSLSTSPDHYCSWISYANSFYDKRWYCTYDCIVSLLKPYGPIPTRDMGLTSCPSLADTTVGRYSGRTRVNPHLQKVEYYVREVTNRPIRKTIDGWKMLLRYFTEKRPPSPIDKTTGGLALQMQRSWSLDSLKEAEPGSTVSDYTRRRRNQFRWRWR